MRFLLMNANANLGTWIAFPSKNLKKVRTMDMLIMITVYMLLLQGHEQQEFGNIEAGHVCIMLAFVLLLIFVVCSFFRYEIFRWTQYSPMVRSVHSITGHNYVNSRPPPMLNLTDGGHIDNLGLLTLLWRKCDVIICSDAGTDPNSEFYSICNVLGIASENGIIRVKKCPCHLKTRDEVFHWMSDRVKKWSYDKRRVRKNLCLVIEFEYVDALCNGYDEKLKDGKIVIVKCREDLPYASHGTSASHDKDGYIEGHFGCCCECCEESSSKNCGMCGPLGHGILTSCCGEFPHQSTANQFMTPNSFEDYHRLGRRAVSSIAVGLQLEWSLTWWRKEVQSELDHRCNVLRRRGEKYFSSVETVEWWKWLVEMSQKMFGDSIELNIKRSLDMLTHIVEQQVPLCKLIKDSDSSKCVYQIDENFAGPGMRLDLNFDKSFIIHRSSTFSEAAMRAFSIVPLAFTTHVLVPEMNKSLGLNLKSNASLKPYLFVQNPDVY